MPLPTLKELKSESESLKQLLGWIMDENAGLKYRLSEVLKEKFDKIMLIKVEDYQSYFIQEDELIGLFRNDIALLDKKILTIDLNDKKSIKLIDKKLKIDDKHVVKAKDHLKLDWQKVSAILIEEKSFLDDHFSIEMVARILSVERKDVLMFIKNNGMKSFQDLINHLKVEYSLLLIKDGYLKKYSMDALAIASGFNHKSSYYRNFKKFKNITPLQVAAAL